MLLPIGVTILVSVSSGIIGLILGASLAAGRQADDCSACIARRARRNRWTWKNSRPHARKARRKSEAG